MPRRLGRRGDQRLAQELHELAAIRGAEAAEYVVLHLHDEVSGALQRARALGGDRDLPSAAIPRAPATFGETGVLDLVDELHHRARVDAHVRAELLLDDAFTRAEHVEQREPRRGEADRPE